MGFTLLSLLLLFNHEPWRDEAQAWLLARDSTSIGALIGQMGYEGSPALWHVILFLPAQLGLPYRTMFIIHFLIMLTAVITFMRHAPFSRAQKILFIFGYYALYEYNAIARNYAISVMLLFFIATMYKNRFERPVVYAMLIFLLSNSNVHNLVISMSLAGMHLTELAFEKISSLKKKATVHPPLAPHWRGIGTLPDNPDRALALWRVGGLLQKKHILSVCIIAAGFFASIHQLTPPKDLAPSYARWYFDLDRSQYTHIITTAINNAFSVKFLYETVRYGLIFLFGDNFFVKYLFFTFPLTTLLSCLIIFATVGCLIRKTQPLLLFLVSSISSIVIFCFKSAGDTRHHGFIFITFVFCLWIANAYRERPCSAFQALIAKAFRKPNWLRGRGARQANAQPQGETSQTSDVAGGLPGRLFTQRNCRYLITIIFSVSTIKSCPAFYYELKYDFSAGKRTANFLTGEKLVNNKTFIATYLSSSTLSIIPFIPKPYSRLYFIEHERYHSFMVWDKDWFLASYSLPTGCRDAKPLKSIYDRLSPDTLPADEITKRVDHATAGKDYETILLILNRKAEDAGDFLKKYHLIAQFANTLVKDESFYLYQKTTAAELWNNSF